MHSNIVLPGVFFYPSKNAINIIAFLILLAIFIGAFSSSYTSRNLTNLAHVLALGIDVGENAKIKSANFSKSKIMTQWMDLFAELTHE